MHDHRELLTKIRSGRKNSKVTAFFDLDRTLIAVYSAVPLLLEQYKAGYVSPLGALQQIAMGIGQSRAIYEFEEVLETAIKSLRGVSEDEFSKMGELLFHKHLRRKVYTEALEIIDAHRQRNHRLVVVSSATRYQIEPVANALGIEDILCTELEVENGNFTGVVQGTPCWGVEKLNAAQTWCKQHKLSLKSAWFYTDALDDLPLLEAVGHPVAVNPSKALGDHAKAEGWPSFSFRSRTRPSLLDVSRTVAMYGSIIPSSWYGKATQLLGAAGKQKAALRSFTTFSDIGLDLAGVKLDIKGEQHLWEQRPAIFVANHQSILDGFIMPKLVQRDYFMMGKQEARDMPFMGKVMEEAGFILFDRSDREAALAACDDAAERIRNGESLCISPEGTRSFDNRLEPFKKGVFHIAIQTRAPIVPVVIKNASELWPRGQLFVRPGTLYIEVLKPVSTKRWKVETLAGHLDDLYQQYLSALSHEN